MHVVERFEGLLPDLGVRGRVHQEHAEKHDVAGDAAGLGVENLYGGFGAEEGALDVEEAVRVRIVSALVCSVLFDLQAHCQPSQPQPCDPSLTRRSSSEFKVRHILDIMPTHMDRRPKRQTPRNLPMPTHCLIKRQPPDSRPCPSDQMPAHRQQSQCHIERQGEG